MGNAPNFVTPTACCEPGWVNIDPPQKLVLARRGSSLGRSRSTYVGQKFPELRALVCQRLSAELPFLVSPVGRSGGLGAWVSLFSIRVSGLQVRSLAPILPCSRHPYYMLLSADISSKFAFANLF